MSKLTLLDILFWDYKKTELEMNTDIYLYRNYFYDEFGSTVYAWCIVKNLNVDVYSNQPLPGVRLAGNINDLMEILFND